MQPGSPILCSFCKLRQPLHDGLRLASRNGSVRRLPSLIFHFGLYLRLLLLICYVLMLVCCVLSLFGVVDLQGPPLPGLVVHVGHAWISSKQT